MSVGVRVFRFGRATGSARGRRRSRRRAPEARSRRCEVGLRALEGVVGAVGLATGILWVLERLGELTQGRPWLLATGIAGVSALGVALGVGLDRLRRRTPLALRLLVDGLCVAAVVGLIWVAAPGRTVRAVADIVAGERATQQRVIRHQVYAAYRRLDLAAQRRILERSEVFAPTIRRAARAFGVDEDLLVGVASVESSFHPRESRDGGRGLFQITAVPPGAVEGAKKALGVKQLDPWNEIHNAFLAAATLVEYGEQMGGDLSLTLLAYNIGPQNGGLRTILEQYGARNFAQVQPYLQPLPREYPVRVLSSALAYRVWRRHGELPRYEEERGSRLVQEVEVPGLGSGGWIRRDGGAIEGR